MSHSVLVPSRQEEKRRIAELMSSGFRHHSYLQEKTMMNAILCQGKEQDVLIRECIDLYMDLLGDSTIRSVKNGLICLITVVSRSAIDYGVEAEYSFAASDYFINVVEHGRNVQEMMALFKEILDFYADLVAHSRVQGYSASVSRAIRFIHAHLYDSLRVKDVASYLGMDPQAFSRLFSSETGLPPSVYIEQKKLEEAKMLLQHQKMSIAQVAEALGYCSSQQFSVRFKRNYHISPKEYRNSMTLI